MFDVIEHDHKKFKSEQVGKTRDLDKKVEELLEDNSKLKELKEALEKQTKDLQVRIDFLWYLRQSRKQMLVKIHALRGISQVNACNRVRFSEVVSCKLLVFHWTRPLTSSLNLKRVILRKHLGSCY